MSTYRFVTTDPLTGRVLADSLPIIGQTMNRQINSIGTFTGALPLGAGTGAQVTAWVEALIPWKSILWVLQDGYPVWNGPVTGWPHQSVLDGTLPIQAATMEQFFAYRQISDNLDYENTDVFEIFRLLLIYALSKTPDGNIAGTGRYANTSGIVDNVAWSGVIASVQEDAWSLTKIYDAWGSLCTGYELEYALTPAMTDDGSLYTQAQMGLPEMGRAFSQTGLTFAFPSAGFLDYMWQVTPTDPANLFVVTGSGSQASPVSYVSTPGAGLNLMEINAGYPLLEDSWSYPGTATSQQQIDDLAGGLAVANCVMNQITPVLKLGAGVRPLARDIILGDGCAFAATSALHPARPDGSPGLQYQGRVTGWTIYLPSDQQAEQTWYQLGGMTNINLLGGGQGIGTG